MHRMSATYSIKHVTTIYCICMKTFRKELMLGPCDAQYLGHLSTVYFAQTFKKELMCGQRTDHASKPMHTIYRAYFVHIRKFLEKVRCFES